MHHVVAVIIIVERVNEMLPEYIEPSSLPDLVLTLSKYDFQNAFVVNKEINTVACFTELMRDVKFKTGYTGSTGPR